MRLRSLIFLFGCVILVACSRPPEIVGIDNPEIPVSSVQNATTHKIFIASTRQASGSAGAFFSARRAPEMGLASVVVSVPPNHVPGELNRPKRLPPDPRTEFAIIEPTVYETDNAFIASINQELSKRPRDSRDILFFIHGYNNTTTDALLRLGQFVEDSDFKGIAVLFDWASAAQLSRYVYDLNSALIARSQIEEIGDILGRTNANGYDIFAHSMGAFLIMEAARDLSAKGEFNKAGRLQNIILASPDIDLDLFTVQLKEIKPPPGVLFVLLSEDDNALRTSRRIAGGIPRVGAADAEYLAELGVVAIDLTEIDDSSTGSHTKFAGSPEVVQILGIGLNNTGAFTRHSRTTQLEALLEDVPIRIVVD